MARPNRSLTDSLLAAAERLEPILIRAAETNQRLSEAELRESADTLSRLRALLGESQEALRKRVCRECHGQRLQQDLQRIMAARPDGSKER